MANPRLNCICIDFSKHCEEAFNWYATNYHRPGDVIGLLHVHQMPAQPPWGMMSKSIPIANSYLEIINTSLDTSRKLVKKFEQKCKEMDLEYKILRTDCRNSPGHVICAVAKENGADTIVLGQRGLRKFSRMLLGSTSDYVLHHSHVPVIVVPPVKNNKK